MYPAFIDRGFRDQVCVLATLGSMSSRLGGGMALRSMWFKRIGGAIVYSIRVVNPYGRQRVGPTRGGCQGETYDD